jgi:hypothetical protein
MLKSRSLKEDNTIQALFSVVASIEKREERTALESEGDQRRRRDARSIQVARRHIPPPHSIIISPFCHYY